MGDAVGRLLEEPSFRSSAERVRAEIDAIPTADQVLAGLLQPPR